MSKYSSLPMLVGLHVSHRIIIPTIIGHGNMTGALDFKAHSCNLSTASLAS